jgi:hypothetical protein
MNGLITKIISQPTRPKASAPQARYISETVEIKKSTVSKKCLKSRKYYPKVRPKASVDDFVRAP